MKKISTIFVFATFFLLSVGIAIIGLYLEITGNNLQKVGGAACVFLGLLCLFYLYLAVQNWRRNQTDQP